LKRCQGCVGCARTAVRRRRGIRYAAR
jgi:hypothetical protein